MLHVETPCPTYDAIMQQQVLVGNESLTFQYNNQVNYPEL